ncbi:hypothetical protein SAMN04488591_1877 [Microbacterium azadirachtae]|uniref:(S)-ureidoglycine aminohydrolase cupin domain-containing protein n=1 Tax=Microbacterium azadirachtae TaxID=582680 RepID=A0A1I6HIT4_9MICO|nr:cupin domain-containing protein [Microbacterium azadirachtae]SFR54379.1 hypothetical protein SAMN04488591_1877 [Microbacterium azadirachtae]
MTAVGTVPVPEPVEGPGARLPAVGRAVTEADLVLAHEPLPAAEVVAGAPATAIAVLDDTGDREIGIWEMTPGAATDTEADELFVVLSGRATIAFEDPSLADLEIGPGSVVRLAEGMRTTWTVTETLRKVYIA